MTGASSASTLRARPNIINAAGILPYALADPPCNCAVYQLSRYLELQMEQVQSEMEELWQRLHPEESSFFVLSLIHI